MATTMEATHTRLARKPLATLGWLSLAALIGICLCLVYLQVALIGMLVPPLIVFAVIALLFAGIVFTGWRWTPLLGALWSSFMFAGNIEHLSYNLTHPGFAHSFAFTAVFLAVMLIGVIAGISATVQNYRKAERRTPRALPYALTALTSLCLGAILVAAIPQASSSAGVSPEALAALPALTTTNFKFDRAEIRAKVGETISLRLQNNDREAHSFDIDAFSVHVPMPTGEQGLALFKATKPGTYTFYCGIPGHRDAMVGTLIVEPS